MKTFFILLFLFSFSIVAYSQNPCQNLDSVNYAGKWYHKIVIGDQCWLKENLNLGTFINSSQNQTDNGIMEKDTLP